MNPSVPWQRQNAPEALSDPANNVARALTLLNAGRVHEAVNECNRQLELNPEQSSALRLRANALRLLGDDTAANESLRRAKAIDDTRPVIGQFDNLVDPLQSVESTQQLINRGLLHVALKSVGMVLRVLDLRCLACNLRFRSSPKTRTWFEPYLNFVPGSLVQRRAIDAPY